MNTPISPSRSQSFRPRAGLAAWLVAAACAEPVAPGPGPGPGPDDPTAVASVSVTPAADTLLAFGDTLRLAAVARDGEGNPVAAQVTWSSSSESVASVTPNGLVTARGNGAVVVTARVGAVSGNATLAVRQLVSTVVVTPASGALTAVGQRLRFSASATDANGNPVTEPPLLWLSSDPRVATVDTAGQVTAQRPGEATVTAAAQGVPGHAAVTVTQTGTTLAFRVHPSAIAAGEAISPGVQVELRDEDGNLMTQAADAVTLTLHGNAGEAPLIGTVTVNAVNGVATFSGLTVHEASTDYTLSADADGYATAVSDGFEVIPAGPAKLAFGVQPARATAGVTMDPIDVEIQDVFGNRVRGATPTVRLVLEPDGQGVDERDAVDGVATFDTLALQQAATGLAFTATSSGLTDARSTEFAVAPSTPAQLVFLSVPDVVEGAGDFEVTVAVHDAFGNVTGALTQIDIVLNGNPASATLSARRRQRHRTGSRHSS